jgi:transcriptional regulator with XRE-family HTH domain
MSHDPDPDPHVDPDPDPDPDPDSDPMRLRAGPGDTASRVGSLIRDAREDRRLTLEQLAAASGICVSTLSMVERAKRHITLGAVDRVLAAMGLQLHVDTQPLWGEIDAKISEMAAISLSARIEAWPIELTSFVSWFAETAYMADGLMAAALQGAPVPVDAFEIAVLDDEDSLDELMFLLGEMHVRRWVEQWRDWDGTTVDPRDAESPPARYRCLHGELRVRLVRALEPTMFVELRDLSTSGTPPSSLRRKVPVLTEVRLPVVPLAEIETSDGWARRVLQRMRAQA